MRFENKKVLITGAGSGIGRATALLMAHEGADIAFTFNSNEEGAAKLCEELEAENRTVKYYRADMTDDSQIDQMCDRVLNEFGEVDILINNAGGLVERMLFFEISREKWDEIMDLNLWSVVQVTQKIAAPMKKRGEGVVVNNASVAGRFGGGPGALAYSVSKGALITMTQGMAKELITDGIRVNAVAPGIIDTPFHDKFTSAEVMQKLMEKVPIGRPGTSEEVAETIAFLASEQSSYMVGATIDINGGMWVI